MPEKPERADFSSERVHHRLRRADFRLERVDFRPERADFRLERAWGGRTNGRTNGRTKKWTNESPPVFYRTLSPSGPLPKRADFRPERADFRPEGLRALGLGGPSDRRKNERTNERMKVPLC